MQKPLDSASSDNFSCVSVLDPLYFSWLNSVRWRHSCILAAFVFLDVLVAGCSGSLFLACPRRLLFALLDNRRCKALLFVVTAKPSETELKTVGGSPAQAELTGLGPEASQTQCGACGFFLAVAILGCRAARTEKVSEAVCNRAYLAFYFLFCCNRVMAEHAVSYFLIYIWP